MFQKILIANRGEIAVRVMRTCREMGVRTVAVYSQADRLALHVRMADEAYEIGPPPARESYLDQERIIATAKRSGAEAIHPGYGFLSENAAFADQVAAAGLIFIGPRGNAMRQMGDKTAARKLMQGAGVPTVPGSKDAIAHPSDALTVAERVGFPVLIKASAGGGGKGMRLVHRAEDLAALFQTASSEARSAFGDGRVYIENMSKARATSSFKSLPTNTATSCISASANVPFSAGTRKSSKNPLPPCSTKKCAGKWVKRRSKQRVVAVIPTPAPSSSSWINTAIFIFSK